MPGPPSTCSLSCDLQGSAHEADAVHVAVAADHYKSFVTVCATISVGPSTLPSLNPPPAWAATLDIANAIQGRRVSNNWYVSGSASSATSTSGCSSDSVLIYAEVAGLGFYFCDVLLIANARPGCLGLDGSPALARFTFMTVRHLASATDRIAPCPRVPPLALSCVPPPPPHSFPCGSRPSRASG